MKLSHKPAIRVLEIEVECLSQSIRCSRDADEQERLNRKMADLRHSILALGIAEAGQPSEKPVSSSP